MPRSPHNPEQPWNSLPELPPQEELESRDILKACIPARAELARVNALVETLPNKDILLHTIPLQEARSSSEIENIVTTSDALYQALASNGSGADANAKDVLRYREALWEGVDEMRKGAGPGLTTPLFEQICSRIRDIHSPVRGDQVWIGNAAARRIIYTPPAGEHLGRLLANLEHFIADDESGIEPLVKMAVIHYQFEAIHPFADGNGRTGRVLNILYLMRLGLLSAPVLYLSRFFIENLDNYYRYLREVTEQQQWRQWILYIVSAVEHTSRDTVKRIEAMRVLMDDISDTAAGKTRAAERRGFIELLFEWPYCKISIVERSLGCSRLTARRYLNEVTDLGLLRRVKRGREYYYVNARLISLLSE